MRMSFYETLPQVNQCLFPNKPCRLFFRASFYTLSKTLIACKAMQLRFFKVKTLLNNAFNVSHTRTNVWRGCWCSNIPLFPRGVFWGVQTPLLLRRQDVRTPPFFPCLVISQNTPLKKKWARLCESRRYKFLHFCLYSWMVIVELSMSAIQ